MNETKDIKLSSTEFCFRANSVFIDGKKNYEKFFYADLSEMNTEHILYQANKKTSRFSLTTLQDNPIAFVSDAVKIIIEENYGTTGLYDPFSSEYCKESYSPKSEPIVKFGIKLFEITKGAYDKISY
ncbi:hypothetical protein [Pelagicoccus sp. SDUM812002]|uniref:hypothetical protein n=1 Tax=Pelagicoccus sp. SDUM812002 TaxID=3041266 RepID=UPI00280F531C|nr:hypothetical protein [Pelagicoccus sp. SDUM812002]MDQ8188642.1 hypothetical protein [Pelagicoccus sp. SDUM812002]